MSLNPHPHHPKKEKTKKEKPAEKIKTASLLNTR
jgi:hypothetical protein